MAIMEEESLESMSYEEAMEQLEALVSEIEKGEVPMDNLILSVKRASTYIAYCREKLAVTASEVVELVDSLNDSINTDDEI